MIQRRIKGIKYCIVYKPKAFLVANHFRAGHGALRFWKLSIPSTCDTINSWSVTLEGHIGCYKPYCQALKWVYYYRRHSAILFLFKSPSHIRIAC